jgi:gas vesicle protein
MREAARIEYRGFGLGHVLIAMLSGAAAGAAVAYFTAPRSGAETRERIRFMSEEARDTATQLPQALRKASEAAKEAFTEAMDEAQA